jgi:hypothetical protein
MEECYYKRRQTVWYLQYEGNEDRLALLKMFIDKATHEDMQEDHTYLDMGKLIDRVDEATVAAHCAARPGLFKVLRGEAKFEVTAAYIDKLYPYDAAIELDWSCSGGRLAEVWNGKRALC